MDDKKIIKDFNDLLVDKANIFVEKNIDFDVLKECNKALIICSGVFTKVGELIRVFANYNSDAELIFISREKMHQQIRNFTKNPYVFIPWEEKYSIKVLEVVRKEISLESIDSFFYVCKSAIDLRDINVLKIAQEINKLFSINVFSYTSGEELNFYNDIQKYICSLKCYNGLIEWVNDIIISADDNVVVKN